jgi:hypothetical protein
VQISNHQHQGLVSSLMIIEVYPYIPLLEE